MTDYPLAPGAYQYRPLKQDDEGWDVWALQSALAGTPGYGELVVDGVFADKTATAVRKFQNGRKLDPVDAIAGIATQGKLCQVLARQFRKGWELPNGIPYGTLEQESGLQLGNHTAPYRNGTRDCGVTQRNTAYATMDKAFDVPDSLMALCRQISEKHDAYVARGVVIGERAWELACGSWNRPAYTDALAQGKTSVVVYGSSVDLSPGAPERVWIEAYISRVCKYVVWH